MYRPTLFASTVVALLVLSQLAGASVAMAADETTSASTKKANPCEKVISAFAKIAQDSEDAEEIRLSTIQAMVDVHNTAADEQVEQRVVEALLAVVENSSESPRIREAAIQSLLEIVRRSFR